MWNTILRMLVEVVIIVVCSQVLLALVGNSSYAKYVRMFMEMLVLLEFCMAISSVLLSIESALHTFLWIGGR